MELQQQHSTEEPSKMITRLKSNTQYELRLSARTSLGQGPLSEPVFFRTQIYGKQIVYYTTRNHNCILLTVHGCSDRGWSVCVHDVQYCGALYPHSHNLHCRHQLLQSAPLLLLLEVGCPNHSNLVPRPFSISLFFLCYSPRKKISCVRGRPSNEAIVM